MKTAEELFDEYADTVVDSDYDRLMYKKYFQEAFKEHDKEIVKMIDDKILKRKKKIKPYGIDDYIDALREIKNEIEKK